MGQQQVFRQSQVATAQFALPAYLDQGSSALPYANDFDDTGDDDGRPPGFPGAGRPRRRMPARSFVIGGVVVIVALLAGLVGCLAFGASINGKLYDNVYVNEQNIGGLTPDAARAALNARLAPLR